jgi:hypothetical protein
MRRPAHGGGRIHRDNLTRHQPVEQMADRGQASRSRSPATNPVSLHTGMARHWRARQTLADPHRGHYDRKTDGQRRFRH